MAETGESGEELRVGARVCQRCNHPIALVARTRDEWLLSHLAALRALAGEWKAPGYLVLDQSGAQKTTRVLRVTADDEPRWLSWEAFGEAQEADFLLHRCVQSE